MRCSIWLYEDYPEGEPTRIGSSKNLRLARRRAIGILQRGENGWIVEIEEPYSGDISDTFLRVGPGRVINWSTGEVVG